MGACKGPYGFIRGPIWFHGRADMGSLERAVMCLESQAVSACVNKHFVTIIGKHVIIMIIMIVQGWLSHGFCLDKLNRCSNTLYGHSDRMFVDFSYVFSFIPRKLYTIFQLTFSRSNATSIFSLILSLPNVTVVEFTLHCQTRL